MSSTPPLCILPAFGFFICVNRHSDSTSSPREFVSYNKLSLLTEESYRVFFVLYVWSILDYNKMNSWVSFSHGLYGEWQNIRCGGTWTPLRATLWHLIKHKWEAAHYIFWSLHWVQVLPLHWTWKTHLSDPSLPKLKQNKKLLPPFPPVIQIFYGLL